MRLITAVGGARAMVEDENVGDSRPPLHFVVRSTNTQHFRPDEIMII